MQVQEEEEQAKMVDVSSDSAERRRTVSEAQQLAQAQEQWELLAEAQQHAQVPVQWELLVPSMAVMAEKLEHRSEQPKEVDMAQRPTV